MAPIGLIGLLVLCAALAYFVVLPRIQDTVREEVAQQFSTQIARQIGAQLPEGVPVRAGEYRLSLGDLEQQIADNADTSTVDSLSLRSDGDELVLSVASNWQTIEYRGVPGVSPDGEFMLTDVQSSGGPLNYLLPPDQLGGAIELGVNKYLQAQGLRLQDVHLQGSDLVFNIVD